MKKNFLLRIFVASIIALCVGYGVSRVTEKAVCSKWDFEDSWIVSIIEADLLETQDEVFAEEWATREWDVRFLFLGGEYRGTEANIRVEHLEQSKLELEPGVSYILSCNEYEDGERQYFVSDVFRVPQLAGIFFGAVAFFCIVTGAAGIRALLGLGLSLFVLIKIFLPGLLRGYSPQIMSIAAVSAVALVTVVTVLRKRRCWPAAFSGAVAGCGSALLFGWAAVALLNLSGLSTEDTSLLASSVSGIDIRGILIASIIVGASGAVLDVAVSVTSAMSEMRDYDPDISASDLFQAGINVGREILGSMINTLVFAYFGNSLVTSLLILEAEPLPMALFNNAVFAEEVIRALAGTAGLLLTIPLTAVFGVFFLSKRTSQDYYGIGR